MSVAEVAPVRFGLIGVDSSHSVQFTQLLGDGRTGAVPGGTVVAAYQAPTVVDFPPSRDRNDQFAQSVAALGVPLLDTYEEVAEAADALLVVASDARTHPDHLQGLTRFGKPVYIDTRFAPTWREAVEALERAAADDCLVLAGSPKRFTPEFREAISTSNTVERVELDGPLPEQPHHPFLAWYGVHLVDLAVAALGPGCSTVDASGERVVLTWNDGRSASLGGGAEWNPFTRGTVTSAAGTRAFEIEANAPMLTGLLESIIASTRLGVPNVPSAEILETVAIVEAATLSRAMGAPITLPNAVR